MRGKSDEIVPLSFKPLRLWQFFEALIFSLGALDTPLFNIKMKCSNDISEQGRGVTKSEREKGQ